MKQKSKENLKLAGIGFLVLLVGTISGLSIDEVLKSDEPLYKCTDEEKIRNCPNGIKSDGLRCYYNKSDSYDYDYCSSKWKKINKEKVLQDLYSDKQNLTKGNVRGKVKCTSKGCVKVNN